MLQPKKLISKKKPFVLQDEKNLAQKDNTPNTKRDLSLMLAEYNNAKKDKQELRTTGQIKNPNSIQYRRNIKTQPDIKQDNISAEQRNAPLNPLQRPLIYLANPEKVLGDLGVPGMETSELDRQTINANKFNPYQSRTDRFLNNAKIGLGYVPEATVNTAMAAAFMPEGSGVLGLVNETLNPLAGTGKLIDNLGNKYLPNAYKYNPRAFKPKTDAYYRQVFSKNEIENPLITRSMQKNNDSKGISAYINSSEEKFLDGNTNKPFELLKLPTTESLPYFNKGKPYYTENYTKFKNNELLLESNKNFKDYEDFNPAATNYMSDKPEQASLALQMSGDIRVLNPFSKEGHNLENYNIYKKDWLQGYKKLQQGGYINQNNMNRYAQGGDLTQFNTGGTHESSPIGGVPIGNNNSVEQGETKQNNFVYSNRIFLDSNIVSQYNLPKSLVGKSVADATKFIDNKFKGRNDKISQSTKNGMLSKIAEAQEAMKPQEPEMEQSQEGMIDPTQMAFGGFAQYDTFDPNAGIGYKFGSSINPSTTDVVSSGLEDASSKTGLGPMNQIQPVSQLSQANSLSQIKPFSTGNQLPTASAVPDTAGAIGGGLKEMSGKTGLGLSSALGAASTTIDLGKTAFGKPAQDTSGLAPSAKVNSGGMIAGSAMKGASAGMAFGPLGAGIGAAVGGVAGLLGSGKAKKAALKNSNNFARRTNAQFSDQYALGGEINQMGVGGFEEDPMYYENLKLTPRNTAPIESISNLKPAGTTVPYTIATQPKVDISNANRQFAPGPSDLDMLKYNAGKIGNYINQNAGNIARYAPIAANALQLSQLKKPQGERLDRLSNRYKPEYVDEAMIRNIADQEANNQINALTQSGASQGAVRNAILGAGLNKTKALSDAYMNAAAQNRATNDRAQTFNLGVDQVNLQQSNTEKENFARDKAAYRNAKREYITGIGEGIGDIGKEQTYKKIIAKTTGYKWDGEYVKSPDGTVVTDPATGKPMTEEKLKEIQSIKDKKALGGYLIKNKVK